ncbi:MAG: hypothetical protein ACFCAD_01180, partial [Pleurocapsa sp.]
QSYKNMRLGQILVRKNLISLSQLKFYLKNQNIKLGDFLVEKKVVNRRRLRNILTILNNSKVNSNNSDKNVSEIILQQSILSEERLKELLIEYYTRRKGLFLDENISANDDNLCLWIQQSLAS